MEIKRLKLARKLGLALALLLVMSLLAACGATPAPEQVNNNFDVPAYTATPTTELTMLENDPKFQDKVLIKDPNSGPETVKAYSTTASLNDVKSFYTDQLTKAGWIDRSSAVIDPTALGSDAWVLGFEKATSQTPTVNYVVGLYMFSPNSPALKDFKDLLPPGNTQNILIRITGTSAPVTSTPAK